MVWSCVQGNDVVGGAGTGRPEDRALSPTSAPKIEITDRIPLEGAEERAGGITNRLPPDALGPADDMGLGYPSTWKR